MMRSAPSLRAPRQSALLLLSCLPRLGLLVGFGLLVLRGAHTVFNEVTVPSLFDLLPAPLGDDVLADNGVVDKGAAVDRFIRFILF